MTGSDVLLFDWTVGGHHAAYLRRFAETLSGQGRAVAVAAPASLLETLGDLPVELHDLGEPRPREDRTKPLRAQFQELAGRELELLRRSMERSGAAWTIHLYGDPILRQLVRAPRFPAPLTVCVFGARFHLRAAYGLSLGRKELSRAVFQEGLVRWWRRRPDAGPVFVLERATAGIWIRQSGAPAVWMPEPPVPEPPPEAERSGALLYGSIEERKGLGPLTDALLRPPASPQPLTIAGPIGADYASEFNRLVGRLRASGTTVIVDDRSLEEAEGLAMIRRSRCVLLPYVHHLQMSRVLLEAARCGTPVVANSNGLLGSLVAQHGLGVAVDAFDAQALRSAVDHFTRDDRSSQYAEALATFADLYSEEAFARQITAAMAYVDLMA